eukprot:CAMPEP_0194267224 /NCGR_PEP_ID=MMETSP0169-20130528/1818_1 /TAXON_ID=218684 /ORGANISM="Corethron pennatum, Strain L29A3" /LENGTH=368 /DNA_ID=CAMNT_0039008035 /DNA_START=187 /DNA_END=1293 /DNA_ORIENTATION=+
MTMATKTITTEKSLIGGSDDTVLTGIFRSKMEQMRNWRPASAPSSRDRLELYALHRQAVTGDCNVSADGPDSQTERAKISAWRAKMGMSVQEATTQYISECNRQLRVYGDGTQSTQSPPSPRNSRTPPHTPATPAPPSPTAPRGVAAVSLICAAASESQLQYMDRMAVTVPHNGWWARQEPLCGDDSTSLLHLPETVLIVLASNLERIALAPPGGLPPNIVQAALWPFHNLLLALWAAYILVFHLLRASVDVLLTVALGSKRTGAPISSSLANGLVPAANAARGLPRQRHALSVRCVGLTMVPLVYVSEGAMWTQKEGGTVAGGTVLVGAVMLTWWYWFVVLPWIAVVGAWMAVVCGGCFALIEFAGI